VKKENGCPFRIKGFCFFVLGDTSRPEDSKTFFPIKP